MKTIRLTAAQAMVRWLSVQMTEDGERFIAGVWGIFGHGNVAGLGEALHGIKDVLPTWRGQNEQTMAHAAIAYAKTHGIMHSALDPKTFPDRDAFDAALMAQIDAHQPDWVVLAGFMRILTPGFVAHYAGRLVNIHPSLLPAFPGLNTHARALEMGCKFAGATVHRVTAELDHGEILAQAVVPVLEDDTADTLAARVLTQEHVMYPKAVAALLAN